ncbi:hypothetical protein HNQ55_001087 [Thalassotalea piscium]|uniref:Uncharacterized protein n=1 Tax=Thalassotalea piscium TaxID=1230533 RepID=A0A7X0NFX5_9GAMM|nr:hypothetical protein [Thalassotalea piscium]
MDIQVFGCSRDLKNLFVKSCANLLVNTKLELSYETCNSK